VVQNMENGWRLSVDVSRQQQTRQAKADKQTDNKPPAKKN